MLISEGFNVFITTKEPDNKLDYIGQYRRTSISIWVVRW
jgi:hypothetical protein